MAETNDMIEENDVMVPMRDGIRLRADVFRPATGGPHPVLVHRYPYSTRDGFMAMFGRMIAAQGYAVVVQSCRGRYGSEGDFYPIHPDVNDSYDTVEWAAAQPWSNGKVGMYGSSYAGMTQWTAAIARPPHLVCLAPCVSTWDATVGGWFSAPGVLTMGLALLWSAQMTAFEAERRGVTPPLPAFAEVAKLQDEGALGDPGGMAKFIALQQTAPKTLFDRRPLRDIEELAELAPWFRDWCDHDEPRDPYWRKTSAAAHIDQIDLPILHIDRLVRLLHQRQPRRVHHDGALRQHRGDAAQPAPRRRPVEPQHDAGPSRRRSGRPALLRLQPRDTGDAVLRPPPQGRAPELRRRATGSHLRDGRERLARRARVAAGPHAVDVVVPAGRRR